MRLIGYHAAHERFGPRELLRYSKMAEECGFQHAMCSDHFHPWSIRQGESGYTWTWLGAALESSRLTFGTVTAPGERYHPAIVAQAAATAANMYPGRFWLAVGTGQLLNEGITGGKWPLKQVRRERLQECVDVIRRLWTGEMVTHHGLITVEQAKLYSLPEHPPALLGAALTVETARWCGRWADGLITGSSDIKSLRERIEVFRETAGARKPVYVQATFLLAENREAALKVARESWATNVLGAELQAELRTPEQFDAAAKFVTAENMGQYVKVSSETREWLAWLEEYFEAGADCVYMHHVGPDQERFLQWAGEHLLPVYNAGSSNMRSSTLQA